MRTWTGGYPEPAPDQVLSRRRHGHVVGPDRRDTWGEQGWHGSNVQPPVLETGALPVELHPQAGPACCGAGCVAPCSVRAVQMGFEPTISALTGRRGRPTPPQDQAAESPSAGTRSARTVPDMGAGRTSAFYDEAAVACAVAGAKTVKEALERLGYANLPGHKTRLREACDRYGLVYPARRAATRPAAPPRRSSVLHDAKAVAVACADARSYAGALRHLGLSAAQKNYVRLEEACLRHAIPPPPRGRQSHRASCEAAGRPRDLTRGQLERAVRVSNSQNAVLRALGLDVLESRRRWLKEQASRLGVQLPNVEAVQPRGGGGRRPAPLEPYLVADRDVNSSWLRLRLIDAGLLVERCAECSCGPVWRGRPLVLRLDHISGNRRDNRLVNLRLLCPNCDSQSETFTGRNRRTAPSTT